MQVYDGARERPARHDLQEIIKMSWGAKRDEMRSFNANRSSCEAREYFRLECGNSTPYKTDDK